MINKIEAGVIFLGILILFINCEQDTKRRVNQSSKEIITNVQENKDLQKGFQLLEASCFSCHSPNMKNQNRIAPSMAEIKTIYIKKGITKESFTHSLIKFINNPTLENEKIVGAIQRFGAMPKFNFSDEKLSQIAIYVYQTKLEMPNWYEEHFKEERQKYKINIKDLSYVDLGKYYAMSTKSVLGKNLKGAIKNLGTDNAVDFCNEKAYPLTDSVALALNTKIKRISDKPRNQNNSANQLELKYINSSKKILANGEKIKPLIQDINGKMVGYYPILTNKMCMQCHGGTNKEVKSSTLAKIKSLYPHDKAQGYTENQLRGIWVVEMNKK